MIENKPREITLIYHSDKMDDKKARAFVESLNNFSIKTLDLAIEKITQVQLAQVSEKMHTDIYALVDESYLDQAPKGTKVNDLRAMEDSEILKLLENSPILIHTPIIIVGDRAYRYGTAYEFIKQGLAIEGGKNKHANKEEISK